MRGKKIYKLKINLKFRQTYIQYSQSARRGSTPRDPSVSCSTKKVPVDIERENLVFARTQIYRYFNNH